jgi:uncharacterized protein (DUF885 family)
METRAPAFTHWLDDFFASYYCHRPVNATFIGKHEHDSRLADYSEAGVEATLSEMEGLLVRLQTLPTEPLTAAEELDRKLAEGFLEIQRWEYTSTHLQGGNPSTYVGEGIFGVISLFLRPFAPLAQRVDCAIARMEAIPTLLDQGKTNTRQAPPAWIQRAIRECTGALAFLRDGVDLLIQEYTIPGTRLRAAADLAAAAFADFQRSLEADLRASVNEGYACGAQALDLLIHKGHFLDMDADAIVSYAQGRLSQAEAYLGDHAKDWGADTWPAALALLADQHPAIDEYYARYSQVWNSCRATARAHRLVTWPDYPIRYVPQPRWARQAAPYLYFLFYRAPAAYDEVPVVDYLVTPIEPDMPRAKQDQLLRATNDSVIKLNHVIHHGSIGHHLQNWHAYRAESRIGQIAAVDCASRIAMFCGGTMAEGWACYSTGLMGKVGFLTPLEQYAEYQTRARMAARAIVDVRLHRREFSLEEATTFYQQHAGMTQAAAQSEAIKNSMFPGTALMYLMGNDMILQLRSDVAVRQGATFDLQRFHDQFLSYGSVPVALIRSAMRDSVAGADKSHSKSFPLA